MQKVIKVKAKTIFLSHSIFRQINQYIIYNKQLMDNTKVSNQKTFIKDLKVEKPKFQNQKAKLAVFQLLLAKVSNKACKDQKKNQYN